MACALPLSQARVGPERKETPVDFKNDYPEYAVIERQIRNARVERAAMVGTLFAQGGLALAHAVQRIAAGFGNGLNAERDRRAIEADAFLRRQVPRY